MSKRLVKEMSSAIRGVTRSRSSTAGRHHPDQDVRGYHYSDSSSHDKEQEDRQMEAAIRASLAEQQPQQQHQQTTNNVAAASETTTSSDDEDVRTDHIHLGWVCPVCTYRNTGAPGITAGQCVMCGTPRGPKERQLMDDYYEIIECEEDEGRSM